MGTHLSDTLKGRIIGLKEAGLTQREISKKIQVPASTICEFLAKVKVRGTTDRRVGSGRIPVLDKPDIAKLKRIVEKHPKTSSQKLAKTLNDQASPRTIRRCLNKELLFGRVAAKKPFLSGKNKEARLLWAYKHVNFSDKDWDNVIWSDESRFKLFGSDGRQYVWRKFNTRLMAKNLQGTIKFGGGSLMLWGCFSGKSLGNLVVVKENLNTSGYIDLLSTNLTKSASEMGLTDYVFQQDNAPCHKSKTTLAYLGENRIRLMDWPAQSPDLNPIENVWGFMKLKLAEYKPKNKEELTRLIKRIWSEIPTEFLKRLVKGMHNRCLSVIKAKGGHIDH